MRNKTKDKVRQFIIAYKNQPSFKYVDFEKHKISYVFFHVMKTAGIIKPLANYNFCFDTERFVLLGYEYIFNAYNEYMAGYKRKKPKQTDENDLMAQTFKQMPAAFTSFEFCRVLAKKGYSQAKIKKGAAALYLKTVAYQNGKNARTWVKNQTSGQLTIHDVPVPVATMTEQSAIECIKSLGYSEQIFIEYIKSLGYKVMKPIKQWEEI